MISKHELSQNKLRELDRHIHEALERNDDEALNIHLDQKIALITNKNLRTTMRPFPFTRDIRSLGLGSLRRYFQTYGGNWEELMNGSYSEDILLAYLQVTPWVQNKIDDYNQVIARFSTRRKNKMLANPTVPFSWVLENILKPK